MWRHLFSLLRKGKYVKKTMELTNDTPPEPSSHMVFTFTSAMSNPVTTCSNFQTPQRNERERERERESDCYHKDPANDACNCRG
jgi:hypothetical protein